MTTEQTALLVKMISALDKGHSGHTPRCEESECSADCLVHRAEETFAGELSAARRPSRGVVDLLGLGKGGKP